MCCSSIFTLEQFVFELGQNSLNWYNCNCTGEKTENSLIYVEHREHTSFITVVCHAFTKFKSLRK